MPANPPMAWNVVSYVYFLTNKSRAVLYIGVTSDLEERMRQHREGIHPNGFAARNHLNRLVYFERFADIRDAIAREKKLKGWKRDRKNALVADSNPQWDDLAVSRLGFKPPSDRGFEKRWS